MRDSLIFSHVGYRASTTSVFEENLLGIWRTKEGKDGLEVLEILSKLPVDLLVGFVPTESYKVRCNIIEKGTSDGQHNCGIWYRDHLVLKCLKNNFLYMRCDVMERVTPIPQHIFGELPFAGSLANTGLRRDQYAADENEQDIYIRAVSEKLNGIRRKLAEAVHNFSLKNPGTVWYDFKFDNVGLDASGDVLLLDRESGVHSGPVLSTIQVLENIEDWGINGQYTLTNVLTLSKTKQTELRSLLQRDRLDVDEFVRDKNPEASDLIRRCYVIPAKFGIYFGMVMQWDLGIRVLLCDDRRRPIYKESKVFFDKKQAETYLQSHLDVLAT